MSSEIKPLLDALPFIKFTDRSIGNHFTKALIELDKDLTAEEYEPDSAAQAAYDGLKEEIEDALLKDDDEPLPPVESLEVIAESELPEAEEEVLEELKLEDEPLEG